MRRCQARQKDVGWRIDYILGTPGIRILDYTHERDADLSDHAPVSAWIEVPPALSLDVHAHPGV